MDGVTATTVADAESDPHSRTPRAAQRASHGSHGPHSSGTRFGPRRSALSVVLFAYPFAIALSGALSVSNQRSMCADLPLGFSDTAGDQGHGYVNNASGPRRAGGNRQTAPSRVATNPLIAREPPCGRCPSAPRARLRKHGARER